TLDLDLLDYLISRQCAIHSLTVQKVVAPHIGLAISKLHMDSLKQLSLIELSESATIPIMEKVTQFIHKEVTLDIHNSGKYVTWLLSQSLAQWVVKLDMSTCIEDIFDLQNIEILNITRVSDPRSFPFRNLGDRLTTLSLTHFKFTAEMLLEQKPHCLPRLAALALTLSEVHGPLQRYLELPNLKHLNIAQVKFYHLEDDSVKVQGESKSHDLPYATLFSPMLSNLETVSIGQIYIDGCFVPELQELVHLQCPRLHYINNEQFVTDFLECLDSSTTSFPSLHRLQIEATWPVGMPMTYPEFAEHYASKRPRIQSSQIVIILSGPYKKIESEEITLTTLYLLPSVIYRLSIWVND
ncbi:hypothetical protein CPB86DRAFT_863219, partial [Serendipita vermifera]